MPLVASGGRQYLRFLGRITPGFVDGGQPIVPAAGVYVPEWWPGTPLHPADTAHLLRGPSRPFAPLAGSVYGWLSRPVAYAPSGNVARLAFYYRMRRAS